MELSENAEEILESLWIATQEQQKQGLFPGDMDMEEEALQVLIEGGYVSESNKMVQPTKKGKREGMKVVRRHRLAERLFTDVLATSDSVVHEKACKFEHLIDRDMDENICTLLGHPKVCPHGKPIPPGDCCRRGSRKLRSVVGKLSQLELGDEAKIAYVHAPESDQLQKLMSMGVLPGTPIRLVQSFPAFVFEMRHTQFAVDKEIADSIFVSRVFRLQENEPEETQTNLKASRKSIGMSPMRWFRRRPRIN